MGRREEGDLLLILDRNCLGLEGSSIVTATRKGINSTTANPSPSQG